MSLLGTDAVAKAGAKNLTHSQYLYGGLPLQRDTKTSKIRDRKGTIFISFTGMLAYNDTLEKGETVTVSSLSL